MKPVIAALFLLIASFNVDGQNYSLEEAISYALTNHNDIKRSYLDQTDAEWQIREYVATGLPKINGSVGYQYFFEIPTTILPDEFLMPGMSPEVQFGTTNNLTAGVSMNTLLFDGTYFVGLKAQRAYKELIESQIGQTQRDIRVNVIKAYLNVAILKESQQLILDNIKSISQTRKETKALYDNGFAEQLDVDRLDLSLQNLQTEEENITELIRAAKLLLKFHMGYPIQNELDIASTIDEIAATSKMERISPDLAYDYSDRVEVGLVDQSIDLTELNIKSIKAGYYPSLTGSVDYNQSLLTNDLFGENNSWFPTGIVGLNLSIPIFDGRDKKSRIERARVQQEELILQKSDLERSIDLEVRSAIIELNNSLRTLDNRQKSQDLAERIYDTTLIKYQEGVGSSLELNQAEIELLETQRLYIDTLYDYLLARTNLERALGKI